MININTDSSMNNVNVDRQQFPAELLSIMEKSTKSITLDTSFKSTEGINIAEFRKVLNHLNDSELSAALLYDFLQTKAREEMNWGTSITAF